MIEIRDLSYWYPAADQPVLRELSWSAEGGFHLIGGDSGSGKSTFLRLLNGLVPHFHGGRIRGSVSVAGHNVLRTPTRHLANEIGFVFQDPELQSVASSVARDIAFGLGNRGVASASMPALVAAALERVGLEGFERRAVRTLSGGERQRVAIAATLVTEPRVVVLDEPLAQLDEDAARVVVGICERLARDGTTIVMAEHRTALLPPSGRWHHVHDGGITGCSPRVGACATPAAQPPQRTTGDIAWSLDAASIGPGGAGALLRDVSASGRAGEIVALTGPNGGGKTTLLRALAGLLPLQGGSVEHSGRIAYLPQNPGALLHRETAREEIAVAVDRSASGGTVSEWLELFSLGTLADRFPRDLSCGQRQRLAIASILATRPGIALLDEPTRGMDEAARTALCQAIETLAQRGCSVVLATHDRGLIATLQPRILHVGNGSVSAPPAPSRPMVTA